MDDEPVKQLPITHSGIGYITQKSNYGEDKVYSIHWGVNVSLAGVIPVLFRVELLNDNRKKFIR